MWLAAGMAQLPRMPFTQAAAMEQLSGAGEHTEAATRARDAMPVTPCACGCGEPVTRAATGRRGRYATGACRMRALRARRRTTVHDGRPGA